MEQQLFAFADCRIQRIFDDMDSLVNILHNSSSAQEQTIAIKGILDMLERHKVAEAATIIQKIRRNEALKRSDFGEEKQTDFVQQAREFLCATVDYYREKLETIVYSANTELANY